MFALHYAHDHDATEVRGGHGALRAGLFLQYHLGCPDDQHCIGVAVSLLCQRLVPAAALALTLTLVGCGSAPRSVAPARLAVEAPSRLTAQQAQDITIYAVGLVGTPYRFGGNTPAAGFDCSGLIGHVYQTRAGVAAPRTVAKLQFWGAAISPDNARSGDLVLFAQGAVTTHAGIYVGGGRFVHAPSTGGEVRLDSLSARYWSAQTVAFLRP